MNLSFFRPNPLEAIGMEVSLVLQVDPDAYKAYEAAALTERERLLKALAQRFAELAEHKDESADHDLVVGDELTLAERFRAGFGIWKDREDLPDFEEMRRGMDRFLDNFGDS